MTLSGTATVRAETVSGAGAGRDGGGGSGVTQRPFDTTQPGSQSNGSDSGRAFNRNQPGRYSNGGTQTGQPYETTQPGRYSHNGQSGSSSATAQPAEEGGNSTQSGRPPIRTQPGRFSTTPQAVNPFGTAGLGGFSNATRPRGINGYRSAPGYVGCPNLQNQFGNNAGVSLSGSSLKPPPVAPHRENYFLLPSLSVAQTYTDNIGLDQKDQAESDYITQILPSLRGCAVNSRISGNFTYQLQGLIYQDNTRYDTVNNQFEANGTGVIIPQHLYLASNVRYGQRTINPENTFSNDNVLRPGNRTNDFRINVSPFVRQDVGALGVSTLRYTYGKAIYTDSRVPNRTRHAGFFNLASPASNTTWSWRVNAFTEVVSRSDESQFNQRFRFNRRSRGTTHFDSATAQLGYQLTQSLSLLGQGGVEDDFSNGENDRFGSTRWSAGFLWRSQFDSVEFRAGKRFFGTSYYGRIQHRGYNWSLALSYREEPTEEGRNQLNELGGGFVSSVPLAQENASLLEQRVFLQKRALVTFRYDTEVTRTTLRAFDENREFQVNAIPDERFYGGDISIAWQALTRTTVTPRLNYEHHRYPDNRENNRVEMDLELSYLLTPTAQLSLIGRHQWQSSNRPNNDYRENEATIQISKTF